VQAPALGSTDAAVNVGRHSSQFPTYRRARVALLWSPSGRDVGPIALEPSCRSFDLRVPPLEVGDDVFAHRRVPLGRLLVPARGGNVDLSCGCMDLGGLAVASGAVLHQPGPFPQYRKVELRRRVVGMPREVVPCEPGSSAWIRPARRDRPRQRVREETASVRRGSSPGDGRGARESFRRRTLTYRVVPSAPGLIRTVRRQGGVSGRLQCTVARASS